MNWISYVYIQMPFLLDLPPNPCQSHPSRLAQNTQLSFLCYTQGSYQLSILHVAVYIHGLPSGPDGKESACSAGDLSSIPGLGRSPGGGPDYPLQYSCLENPHGQRSLEGYSPWGHKELDMNEWMSTMCMYVCVCVCVCIYISISVSISQFLPPCFPPPCLHICSQCLIPYSCPANRLI